MDMTVLLARIIGPYMLIVGAGLLLNRVWYQERMAEIQEQPLVLLVAGAFTLILGLLMLQFHHVWSLDAGGLITLVGWITALKGALALLWPAGFVKMARVYRNSDRALTLQALLALLFGTYMSYIGLCTTTV